MARLLKIYNLPRASLRNNEEYGDDRGHPLLMTGDDNGQLFGFFNTGQSSDFTGSYRLCVGCFLVPSGRGADASEYADMIRDIAFTADNALAVLEERKWHTRRMMRPQIPVGSPCFPHNDSLLWGENADDTLRIINCPYARELRMLEPYRITGSLETCREIHGFYLADGAQFDVTLSETQWERFSNRKRPYGVTPGRFMYRSISRVTIHRQMAVGQRLSEISDEDALAEGVHTELGLPPRKLFFQLWDTINKEYPAGSDPMVWAIKFKHELNGDRWRFTG